MRQRAFRLRTFSAGIAAAALLAAAFPSTAGGSLLTNPSFELDADGALHLTYFEVTNTNPLDGVVFYATNG